MPADAQTAADRWVASAGAAQQRFSDGVQATTKDPTALAVAQVNKLMTNFQQAVSSGRWGRNLQKVGKSGWQAATLAKASNYATGIQAGQAKYQSAMGVWIPIINSAAAQVHTMPKNTIQDSAARAVAFMTALHNAKLAR